ncbi:MAG: class I SAM-dependent methyltransferase [Pseudomonadota bacterium]
MTNADEHLKAVYGAENPEETAQRYNAWAQGYEADMARAGYRHPAIVTALCARHLAVGAAPLLDAGAGTGLIGDWLSLLGYPQIEALDVSEGMLGVARQKGVYSAFHNSALGQSLPFEDARFAGIVCAGVFTTGHAGAEALPELRRCTKEGGYLILTVKETLWSEALFPSLASAGLALLETTDPYISMPREPSTSPSRAVVLKPA